MSDELDILRRARTPAPSDAARGRAVLAAMEAFNAADEKGSPAAQGSGQGARHRGANRFRNLLMTLDPARLSRPAMATALALMILPVGVYVASNLHYDPATLGVTGGGTPGGWRWGEREERIPARSDAVVAEAPPILAEPPAAAPRRMSRSRAMPSDMPVVRPPELERYPQAESSGFVRVAEQPVSTFSADVDTASYARVRRAILNGELPPADMVRTEEMVNYFDYGYPLPETRDAPFRAITTVTQSPWNAKAKLLHIGIQGFDVVPDVRPRANLVLLIDTSGSMRRSDKLPLLVRSFELLLSKLGPDDTVSIVTYAGGAGTALEPTKVAESGKIMAALRGLRAGGSTAGAAGIEEAYALAERSFAKGGVNRVLLATDGDFNVGLSDPSALKSLIAAKRESGVFLSVLGFGTGNLRDDTMQALAQNGNGTAAYIDTLAEARKVLVDEAGSTLFPIAKDVKLQVEFNPSRVSEYRLVGYETRMLAREDFNDDRVDAGDIGSGHSVTAIYEYLPRGASSGTVDPLRYGGAEPDPAPAADGSDEIAFLKIRYKLPDGDASRLITAPVAPSAEVAFAEATADTRFSIAVAAFAQKLRGARWVDGLGYERIREIAAAARGTDENGYRGGFVQLVGLAEALAKTSR